MNWDPEILAQWIIDLMLDMEEHKPYTDTFISDTEWIREFDVSITNSEEYIWHRDTNDRKITVLEGEGWKFQFDDELPIIINKGEQLIIPKMIYHRLILGKTNLKIRIEEVK